MWLKNLSKFYPRSEYPGLDGPDGKPQKARDLVILQALQLVKPQRLAQGQRQFHQGCLDKALGFRCDGHVLEASRVGRARLAWLGRVAFLAQEFRASLLSTQVVPGTVH